jgi:glyoxylase-like metal-dependent hydrolase (beta-lactamase superfamily II)
MDHNPTTVATGWFRTREVDDSLSLIVEPHVDPWLRSNTWLIRGREADMLVDTANGLAPLRPVVESLRGDDGAKPLVAVVTHSHTDHMGGLHEFEERVAHVLEAPDLAGPRDAALLRAEDFPVELRRSMEEEGDPIPAFLIDALPHEGFDLAAFEVIGADVTRTVEEGDLIDLGDRAFEVLHLPGHTRGSIGLWEPATGTLFSGDTVYRDDTLLDDMPTSDVADYVASMRRLRGLSVEVVHGGHDPSFGRERLIERCDEYVASKEGA